MSDAVAGRPIDGPVTGRHSIRAATFAIDMGSWGPPVVGGVLHAAGFAVCALTGVMGARSGSRMLTALGTGEWNGSAASPRAQVRNSATVLGRGAGDGRRPLA